MMEYCVHCGSEIPDDADHCVECGAKRMEGRPVTLLEQTGGFSQTYDLEPADEEYEDGEYAEYDETLGTGGFLGSLLLMSIPVVGLLIGLIWAFGGSRRVSRQKLAQAYLLFILIAAAVAAACIFLFSSFLPPQMEKALTVLLELIK